jgi:excinuclease ABC subunit C
MQNPTLALQIQTTDSPGVYQYYDKDGKILYVGKAKNLKRVSSYFNKIHDTAKTNWKKIVTIKHIVVPTETDALLLENNLIKTLRYNVLLRDDKVILVVYKKRAFARILPLGE